MKISISTVLAHCTLFYFQYFFTIDVGIGICFLYFHWYLKKDAIRVKFGTHNQTGF